MLRLARGLSRNIPQSVGVRAFVSSRPCGKQPTGGVVVKGFVPQDFSNIRKELDVDYRLIDPEKESLLEDVLDSLNGETGESALEKADLHQLASFYTASPAQIMQRRIANTIKKYARFPGDTGSTEVQVAVLSERILWLREHLANNRKDQVTKRAITKYFHQRRRLMMYLKRERFALYNQMLIDYDITEEEIWEWGRLADFKVYMSRYKGAFTESRFDREKREKREAEEKVLRQEKARGENRA